MSMVNPPHPYEFIREVYLETLEISSRAGALRSMDTMVKQWNPQSQLPAEGIPLVG